jgi:hypothetical protein
LIALVLAGVLVISLTGVIILKRSQHGIVAAVATPTPYASLPPGASPNPPLGVIKPETGGLIDRGRVAPHGYEGVVGIFVANVHWADLQPFQGGPIVPNNPIDKAIARAHQDGLKLKLRLFEGIWAPPWAKNIDGPPIAATEPQNGVTGTVGRFWTAGFRAADQDLQRKLAALYDNVDVLQDVTISRCTTVYAEPFMKDAKSAQTVSNLRAAGYTDSADEQCIKDSVVDHAVWAHTHSSLSFNPYQDIHSDGTFTNNEAVTDSMMDFCRATLGQRCTLENNSLGFGFGAATVPHNAMYEHMKALGGPIVFQTAGGISSAKTLDTLLSWAAAQEGACAIELPGGYSKLDTPAELEPYAAALAANAR